MFHIENCIDLVKGNECMYVYWLRLNMIHNTMINNLCKWSLAYIVMESSRRIERLC